MGNSSSVMIARLPLDQRDGKASEHRVIDIHPIYRKIGVQ
jgi:hypothetical protein